jgi:hypothetical protein
MAPAIAGGGGEGAGTACRWGMLWAYWWLRTDGETEQIKVIAQVVIQELVQVQLPLPVMEVEVLDPKKNTFWWEQLVQLE